MATELAEAYVTLIPSLKGASAKIASELNSIMGSGGVSASGKTGGLNIAKGISGGLSTAKIAIGNAIGSVISTGVDAIVGSLDTAISRVDTLNQFPRVMENIGYSTDTANAAMERMSYAIEGLPTTLDGIVSNTQMLTMSLGDLDEATDVAIALNDGFVTFGATSYDVTEAITQLNQMITLGKYDMNSWNSINQRAPGYLDTVAKAMLGAESSASELREALNAGDVSTQDFLDTIKMLDTEGADGVTAFAESAKTATGGIATSWQNVQTAIAKNVANVINEIEGEDGRITGFLNGMKGLINSIGGSATSAVRDLIQMAEDGRGVFGAIETAMAIIGPAFEELIPRVQAVAETFGGSLSPAITKFVGAFSGTLRPALEAGSVLFGAIETAAGAFAAAMGEYVIPVIDRLPLYLAALYEAIKEAEPMITALADILGTLLAVAVGVAVTAFEAAIEIIWAFVTAATEVYEFLANEFIPAVQEFFGSDVPEATDAMVGAVGSIPGKFAEFLGGALQHVASFAADMAAKAVQAGTDFLDGLSRKLGEAVDFVSTIPSRILDALGSIGSLLWDAGSQIMSGLLSGIKAGVQGVYDFVSGIGSTIASLKGPKEYDLKLLIPNGGWIMESLAEGIDRGFPKVKSKLAEVTKGIASYDMSAIVDHRSTPGESIQSDRDARFELYLDGKQITDVVVKRIDRGAAGYVY